MGMSGSVDSIIASIGTSLIVSSVTFIFGLKSGKNQSDRQMLRSKYRDMSVHFNELLHGIKGTNPKVWTDYKLLNNRYSPLMVEKRIKGESIELNQNIVLKCESLETRFLQYSNEYGKQLLKVKDHVINELDRQCSSLVKERDYEISTTKDTIGKSFRQFNYGLFLIDSEINRVIESLENNAIQGVCLNSKTEGGGNHWVRIYSNSLDNISVEDFFREISDYIKNDENIIELLKERSELIKEAEKLIKIINKRVKEPFTFLETIVGAVKDIFKI